MVEHRVLKQDVLGSITAALGSSEDLVIRDTTVAPWWARWLARLAARREATALRAAAGVAGIPPLVGYADGRLRRGFIAGDVMHAARPTSPEYFSEAFKLLRRMHGRGVAHNDLAKESNWLCTPEGRPAVIDFQLAWTAKRRGRIFRALAREDLRHLFKHKRTYLPGRLTARQHALLATPSWPARAWRRLVKPPYVFLTRRIFGWRERHGPTERGQARP